MNYLEIDINGKKGFKLGLGFLGELLDHLDTDINALQTKLAKNPFKTLPTMMFFAHKYDCERKGLEVAIKQHDIADWIDENGGFENSEVKRFIQVFTDSMAKDVPVADSKKKAS